jgi:hypothetical protein
VTSDATAESYFETARKLNPNLLTATGLYRGYMRMEITQEHLRTDLVTVDTVKEPDAGRKTLISYVVEAGKPTPVAV